MASSNHPNLSRASIPIPPGGFAGDSAVPASSQLPKVPSVRATVANQDICRIILETVLKLKAHIPPKTPGADVADALWNAAGTGPFDGHFEPWLLLRRGRQIKDRVSEILKKYAHYDTPYPSTLQTIAKRVFDEMHAGQLEEEQRAAVERRQVETRESSNNLHEGTLGLIPRRRGTGIPSLRAAGTAFRQSMQDAASLVAQNPRSQNNHGEGNLECFMHYTFIILTSYFSIQLDRFFL